MRPLSKWVAGTNGVVATYVPYGNAKHKLLDNFGNEPYYYCSYCDRVIPKVNIEVEHVQPIEHNVGLENSWSNFLIACKNCNLAKGSNNILPATMLLPQHQNTLDCFLFNGDGTVNANPVNISGLARANVSIALLGLDRGYAHPNLQPQDDRYDTRRYINRIAKRALQHYESGVPNFIDFIIDLARTNGYWSIWMNVFRNHLVIQNRLISDFNGTYQDCLVRNVDRL